jgi:hypothetical protein
MRLILTFVVLLLLFVGGAAVALHHFFGWKGLIAFPFVLVAVIWAAKVIIGRVIRRFFTGLFGMKSVVLRGAALAVHGVVPVPKPPEEPMEEEESSDDEPADEDEEEEASDDTEESEEDGPREYFAVDCTITPEAGDGERVWEPGELILTTERVESLEDLSDGDKDVGHAQGVLIWNGSEFGPDDGGKYPGEQRLQVTFAVKPGCSRVWMHYYNEPLGELDLPPWTPG